MQNEKLTRSSWYESLVLPYLLDFFCGMKTIQHQREKIVSGAEGRVLEIGFGTGRNLSHYNESKVEKIVALEPFLHGHRLTRRRIGCSKIQVETAPFFAEKMPFSDASFNSVVMTYTLCTVFDPKAVLNEICRVLRPDGKFFFCEHGLAPEEKVRRWQRRLQPYWKSIAGGCCLERDVHRLLNQAGFDCRNMQAAYLSGPRWLSYNYWGEAFLR